MDLISIVGLLTGLAAIIVGQIVEGGHIGSLLQPTAFMIVMGGTFGAVLLQSPWRVFSRGCRMVVWIFHPPRTNAHEVIAQVVAWSGVARREGLLALESRIATQPDTYVQKALQLLVDGIDPERIQQVLEVEIDAWEAEMKHAAKIWEAAGGYSPTIGILGAVMGLIHVMENLTDPAKLGAGIAVAFVATIYGVGAANLIFLPMSKKLMSIIAHLVAVREMILDGVLGIAHGDNPRLIESRLSGYIAHHR
ncbi:flagellar motor protein [Uliginosibacterium gangwonense]|uniref:flagellar motor protein n=1 Tax=Uliginosibacterium gangwonense TaxID=392736 RepID=UPI0003728A9A|nr:flagellar motor protein [Uliginosibacterium gangwonense]